jgi:probable O-glycosylation ligase (exosortase A-associated)
MRDLVMLLVLPFMVYAIMKRPFIGVALWLWTALFNPNGWVYGIAGSIRYNLLFAILTFISYMFYKDKIKLKWDKLSVLVLIFTIISVLSTMFTIGNSEIAWEYQIRFLKTIALFFMIITVFKNKLHIDTLIWVIALSTCFYGCVEGLKFIASGGGHKIAGMKGHALADNNELALAFTIFIPLIIYLGFEYGKKSTLIKLGSIGMIILLVVSVLGTNSRGGLIALLVVIGYFFFISSGKIKLYAVLALSLLLPLIFSLLPEEWFLRMNTIENATEDSSFMGRVIAWKIALLIAIEHPFLGGGIKAIENHSVWLYMSTYFDNLSYIPTPEPDLGRGYASHSIYFQVLSETGFLGLFIFLYILKTAFNKLSKIILFAKNNHNESYSWVLSLGKMLRVSLVAYCIGGAALNFAYFEGIYAILAIIYVLEHRVISKDNNVKMGDRITKRELRYD